MKVLVAGAGGAVGGPLVVRLMANHHDVVAITRSERTLAHLGALGVQPLVADLLDRDSVLKVVQRAEPEAVIHQATSLAGVKSFKRFDREFAVTNRLRTEGTDHLLEAARTVGVRRFIAQSYGNWNYERSGRGPKTEDDPFDPKPPANQAETLRAVRYLENAVVDVGGIDGVALRYGNFCGPGTGFAADGEIVEQLRKRRLPIVGDGAGVWSFIHVDDAASATIAALDRGRSGVYNIVDDEPASVAEWLPELARVVGAKAPLRVPVWLGRLVAGEVGVSMMTQIRGTSNAKARRDLDWQPRHPSYRESFRDG